MLTSRRHQMPCHSDHLGILLCQLIGEAAICRLLWIERDGIEPLLSELLQLLRSHLVEFLECAWWIELVRAAVGLHHLPTAHVHRTFINPNSPAHDGCTWFCSARQRSCLFSYSTMRLIHTMMCGVFCAVSIGMVMWYLCMAAGAHDDPAGDDDATL